MLAELANQLSRITQSPLNQPAGSEQLEALHAAYDVVPSSLIELFSFANGEADSSFKSNGMIAFEAFIGVSQIVHESDFATSYDVYHGLNEFIGCKRINGSKNWHDGLIPISFGYDARCVCIDMQPGPAGKVGQILGLRPTVGGIAVVANGLDELLERTLSIYQNRDLDFSDPDCPCLTLDDFPVIPSTN